MTYQPHPLRIQRKRTKGWRMPPGAIYCGRPTAWGNPFCSAVTFAEWLQYQPPYIFAERWRWIHDHIHELRGRQLACWCSLDVACHVDTLARLANKEQL